MPQGLWARESLERQCAFELLALTCAVVEHETIAIRGKHKRCLQGVGIGQGLLHPITKGMAVVLGFNDSDWYMLIEQHIVRPASTAPSHHSPADDNSTRREGMLAQDLLF